MTRTVSIVLAFLLLLGLGSAAAEEPEIKGDLVLYSSMTDNDLNNLLDLIAEYYPDLTVDIVNGSAGELTARLRAESANPIADMMWGRPKQRRQVNHMQVCSSTGLPSMRSNLS